MIHYSTQPGSPVVEITVEGTVTNHELEEAIKGLQTGFDRDGWGPITGSLPVSERLAEEVVSLPMHAYLDEATQDRIIAAVVRALAG